MERLEQILADFQARTERALDARLPGADTKPHTLHEAIRYSVLGKGKRIRPVLVYATGQMNGAALEALDAPACAVEMIHAYSLIHDDLPAMDDDALRRGQPTCHVAYDEATAILAGDSLQALAFYVLTQDASMTAPAERRLKMLKILSHAIGSAGMTGGQAIDLAAVGKKLNIEELENMHAHKTGALFKASVELGALSQPELDMESFDRLSHYAKCIGLAFQVRDDILDVTSDTTTLGKSQGADAIRNKPTYPDFLGLQGAEETAKQLCEEAVDSLSIFDGKADTLRWIADYIVRRDN